MTEEFNMEEKLDVLFIVDYQKGFLNDNAKKIIKPLSMLIKYKSFDYIIQSMWFNSGVNNFTELVDYEDCKVDGRDAGLKKLFPKAHVFPRVNRYSSFTEDLKSMLKYNMHIYLCGLEIDACVMATAFDLFDYGFKFNVIRDCTLTKNNELQKAAELIMIRQFGNGIFIESTNLYEAKENSLFKMFK